MKWFDDSVDLVETCLKVNPVKRLPANQLLLHPLFHPQLHSHPHLHSNSSTTVTVTAAD